MTSLIYFGKSKRKGKKYMAVFKNPTKTIHFGSDVSQTYTEGATKTKRENYIKRHKVNENWDKLNAGSLSRFVLWGDSTKVSTNLKSFLKKFKIKDERIQSKYVPASLSDADKEKQIKSIIKQKDRPKLKSFKSKRSSWAEMFEKRYKTKINDIDFIDKNILDKKGIIKVLNKGMGAYYSSGSRPNQTPASWSLARLASVIMGGPARRVDKKIWEEHKKI